MRNSHLTTRTCIRCHSHEKPFLYWSSLPLLLYGKGWSQHGAHGDPALSRFWSLVAIGPVLLSCARFPSSGCCTSGSLVYPVCVVWIWSSFRNPLHCDMFVSAQVCSHQLKCPMSSSHSLLPSLVLSCILTCSRWKIVFYSDPLVVAWNEQAHANDKTQSMYHCD